MSEQQIINVDLGNVESDKKQVIDIVQKTRTIVVTNQIEYDNAGDFLKIVRDVKKRLKEKKETITSPLEMAKKAVFSLFNPMLERLDEMDKYISDKRINYFQAEEKKRLDEEEKLKKQAEVEEAKRKKELEEQAKKWEEKGNIEKAEERRQRAQTTYIAPKEAQTVAPKTKGIALVANWKGEVIDLMALVKAVAEGKASINLLEANQTAINKQAGLTHDTLQVPGLKFFNKPYEAARR